MNTVRLGRRKEAERRFEDSVVPHLRVVRVELVRRDAEAAVRLDQDGRGGRILAVFQHPLRIALK